MNTQSAKATSNPAEVNLLDRYPRSKRPIDARSQTVTEEHRRVARQFGKDYFDGDRFHGYGGYNYHPRFWQKTVRRFRDYYNLAPDASILDVGCAKGFMLQDFKELMPDATLAGIDVSQYALEHAHENVSSLLKQGDARDLPFEDNSFDLVIAINTVHNLPLDECKQGLGEIQRVSSRQAFVMVDAWRTDEEKERLMEWNLTALTYMHVDQWKETFTDAGYTGEYYWFIAE